MKEIACKVKNKNKENAISETFTNSAEFGIISQKEFFDHEVASKTNLDSYYIVDIDDFVYNPRISVTAPVGPINRNKLGKAGVMSPLYTVFKTQGVSIDFLEHYFKSTNWHSYMYLNGDSGARSDRFSIKDDVFFDMPIMVPCIKEQMQIGLLFNAISKNITLHQRKPKLLSSNLNFFFVSEYAHPWEQCKLGDLAEIVGGGTPSTSKDEYWDGEIDWYAPAEIANQIYVESSERKITSEGLNNSSAKMLPVGTVLFTSRAGIGKMAILRKEACTNQGFQSIVPHVNELDSYFIFSRSEELKRYGETVGAGSTFVEVSGKQMSAMPLMMPPTIDEQRKIGEYFSSLDNLITLHQR